MRGGKPKDQKYEECIKPKFEQIKKMAQTMTEKQICDCIGIGYTSTWYRAKKNHPELVELLRDAKMELVSELKSKLIEKAKGYEYTETKETRQKVQWPEDLRLMLIDAGFTEQQISQAETVKTETFRKKMAPDVNAINLLLKNHDKENWSNDPKTLEMQERELALRERLAKAKEWK